MDAASSSPSAPDSSLLERLADEQQGTYTDGRFVTLNSVIEEERAEIQIGDARVYVHHIRRKSVRPSMAASFWRLRVQMHLQRHLHLRLVRRRPGQWRWPWHRVFWQAPQGAVVWETRGRVRLPVPDWHQQKALHEALSLAAAKQVLIRPRRGGTYLEMHLKGEPRDYAVLNQQWHAFIRLMECVMLAD